MNSDTAMTNFLCLIYLFIYFFVLYSRKLMDRNSYVEPSHILGPD